MTKLEAEIIIGLADNQMSVSKTAKKIYMHRTTLNYHIKKIRESTGKNPLDFHDLCDLLAKARYKTNGTLNALHEMGRKAHPNDKENNDD